MGTPPFAVPSLAALLDAGHDIVEVVTQPDRPKGRKQELAQSAVKQYALARHLSVFQPERARRPEAVDHLRALQPELMVVVGYGQILPQTIIDIALRGILNVHASLLPKLRGAAPIQWAIANGDPVTGVTIMRIDAGLDTGDMLAHAETVIAPEDDAVTLGQSLSVQGAELLVQVIAGLDDIVPQKQNNAEATYAPLLKKENGRVDWTRSARQISDQARGFQPWPGAFTTFRGQQLNLWKTSPALAQHEREPGFLLPGSIARVTCGQGTLLDVRELQLEGRTRVRAEEFMNGLQLRQMERLGPTV